MPDTYGIAKHPCFCLRKRTKAGINHSEEMGSYGRINEGDEEESVTDEEMQDKREGVARNYNQVSKIRLYHLHV